MRWRGYILFSVVVLLVQVVLLNNLILTPYIAPMVYIAVIAMMPIESSQWKMLFVGLLIGLLMDFTMGTSGLNVLSTLPIAYLRHIMLSALGGLSSMSKEEGIPSVKRLGMRFHRYLIILVVLHSLLFYTFEWLSLSHLGVLVLRILCSTLLSLLLIYLLIFVFSKQLTQRL